jgi:hypothetical protein
MGSLNGAKRIIARWRLSATSKERTKRLSCFPRVRPILNNTLDGGNFRAIVHGTIVALTKQEVFQMGSKVVYYALAVAVVVVGVWIATSGRVPNPLAVSTSS